MFNTYPYTDFHELNLDWFLDQFKDLISDWNTFKTDLTEQWEQVSTDWQTLYNYVHDYFDNLDVQTEIDNKLDEMAASGALLAIAQPAIAETTEDWLAANITQPTTPVVDASLSISGAAADAAVTGLIRADVDASFYTAIIDQAISASGNTWYPLTFIPDHVYILENKSVTNAGMFCHTTNGNNYTYIEDINANVLLPGNKITFIPTLHASTLNVYANDAAVFSIVDVTTIKNNYDRLNDLDATIININDTINAIVDNEIADNTYNINQLKNNAGTGENIICNFNLVQGGINGQNGTDSISNVYIRSSNYFYGDGTYKVHTAGQKMYVALYDADHNFIGTAPNWGLASDYTFDLTDGNCFRISSGYANGDPITPADNQAYVELQTITNLVINDFDAAFQPYSLCKMACHQGYPLNTTETGRCLASQYIIAAEHGFTIAEGDIKFTYDDVPVMCHDATFIDATSGQTITIANETFASLRTHDYYGHTISSLDEVLAVCRQYGMDFIIDQFSYANLPAKQTIVFNIIKKYRMEDNVIFNVYTSDDIALADAVYSWYPDARICMIANTANDVSTAISRANTYKQAGKFSEIIIATTYLNNSIPETLTMLQTLNATKENGIKTELWYTDVMTWITPFLPYLDYYVSNRVSNKDIILA